MVGWILFHQEDPEHWGNIGDALLSLFQILTLEDWPAYLERGQDIVPASWTFFVSYVLLASFLVINILIAIIINSVEEVHAVEKAANLDRADDEIAGADGSVADLESADGGASATPEASTDSEDSTDASPTNGASDEEPTG